VVVAGYEPKSVENVDLGGEGLTAEVAVALKRDDGLARYRITFPDYTAGATRKPNQSWAAPYLVARMHYLGPDRPGKVDEPVAGGWRSMADVTWDAASASYSLSLHPEDQGEFLFWFPTLRLTGWARVGGGKPGQKLDIEVPLSAGVHVASPPLTDEAHGALIGLQLTGESPLGELPLMESRDTGVKFFFRPERLPVGGSLGPFPGNAVQLRAVYADGFRVERSYPDGSGESTRVGAPK
jgi:hypothetical protein